MCRVIGVAPAGGTGSRCSFGDTAPNRRGAGRKCNQGAHAAHFFRLAVDLKLVAPAAAP